MTDQQQQRSSSSTGGTNGRPPPSKSSNTTGNNNGGGNGISKAEKKKAARDRKKARNKQQKNNNQQQQPQIKFNGYITDTEHQLYKRVIIPNGHMADQFHVYKIHIKLHCSSKGHYKLSSCISSNTILCQADFLSPMPDPLQYSTQTTAKDGTVSYVVTNPAKQEELKTIWGKNLNNEISKWSKYEEFSKGLFETTIGQLHDSVLA
jgi:hypothetical protein